MKKYTVHTKPLLCYGKSTAKYSMEKYWFADFRRYRIHLTAFPFQRSQGDQGFDQHFWDSRGIFRFDYLAMV